MARSQPPPEASSTRRDAALWVGVLAPPLAWLFLLQVSYSVVTTDCRQAQPLLMHGLTLGALLLVGVGALAAWRSWKALRAEPASLESEGPGRARFMALLGLVESALFALVIVSNSISTFLLSPCD
ncbi:hypothetical protein [Hyalangium rubrum]|uniref:Uncharacterized protein n=1 Tax=Hyalangium rubrum TaxID=3103134 RepID=A0ABU5H2K6_9BACT|nr:hypothetical protein [Hyalangium sp. s54d21]MDY7227705.1 hypothetical protein [Hyalangium sp. s54d21]